MEPCRRVHPGSGLGVARQPVFNKLGGADLRVGRLLGGMATGPNAAPLLDHFAIFECPAGTGLKCIYHISTEGDEIEDQGGALQTSVPCGGIR